MFLPEDLLFKSGQLARVWLAANQHKKLTKAQVLQDKIDEDIQVIIRPEGAAGGPLALRLNGQLLLGVVRIYHRKAHYLHDDCNDALWKIKMAFRPGNIDLPTQTHAANPTSLTLPDMITDLDLLAPMPDPSFLLSQTLDGDLTLGNVTLPDWDASQFLSNSVEQARHEEMELHDMDDLEIDLGEDLEPEIGRDAPAERPMEEEFGTELKLRNDDDFDLDVGEDGLTELGPQVDTELNLGDTEMGGMDVGTELLPPMPSSVAGDDVPQLTREDSPLSELGEEEETRLAQEIAELDPTMLEPGEEEESIHQARAKRRKVITQDAETMISTAQLRDQQANRDKILKQASFLPRDPLLMALLNMQKSGGFVSSILGDGRSQGWAPELRGILSLEVVSRPSKRKRDNAAAGLEQTEDEAAALPELDVGLDELSLGGGEIHPGDTTIGGDDPVMQLPSDIGDRPEIEEEAFSPIPDNFDDTTAPLYHPAESGPISLGTKHAVHLLREQFGPEAEESESIRQKNTIVFQELLPEAQTSRADATKMFFEVLVLATKDAIKVDQPGTELGGPLRIRAKRGLWGQWAETAASGELASQSQAVPTTAVDAPAESILAGPAEVSVSA
ncbi:Rec8 like protein-domain-containing protein [Boeremia exigua]|uniref:Rec8 like protein-domain-containing protein n=1 Tax=Boeremia exigua TaxID=749465 RepID=UPI001E8DF039|nr:Rec8 like protein-domain-containing protein [Boeremia exigua]KAH6643729.1 Rec8 like protein-domain-containing protein [Boeremia exigua]